MKYNPALLMGSLAVFIGGMFYLVTNASTHRKAEMRGHYLVTTPLGATEYDVAEYFRSPPTITLILADGRMVQISGTFLMERQK